MYGSTYAPESQTLNLVPERVFGKDLVAFVERWLLEAATGDTVLPAARRRPAEPSDDVRVSAPGAACREPVDWSPVNSRTLRLIALPVIAAALLAACSTGPGRRPRSVGETDITDEQLAHDRRSCSRSSRR